jgi:hypothetical protein
MQLNGHKASVKELDAQLGISSEVGFCLLMRSSSSGRKTGYKAE